MKNIFTQGNGMGGMGFRPMNFRPMGMGQTAGVSESAIVAQGWERGSHETASQVVEGQPVMVTERNPMGPDQTNGKVKSGQQGGAPGTQGPSRDRFQWALKRVCSIMANFAENEVEPETQSQVFWSYARHSKVSEDAFLKSYTTLCPNLTIPAKPAKPEKVLEAESPEKAGFHGKTQISYAEAKELLMALDEVLKPLTPEESASELASQACLRDFSAGNFPIVEELREDLFTFVAAGDEKATFEISKGQVIVAGKAIDCAVALGRGKAVKTAMTVGGIGAGAGLLWLLLL